MHKTRKNQQSNYFLSFLLPSGLLLGMYIVQRVYPFGNHTVATADMANQYLAIMTYFKHNITHPSNFLYSYQASIGGNFFSVLTYYLMSPFNFLTLLFPEKYIPLFYALNTVVDAGLLGLTTYVYLKNSSFLNRNLGKGKKIFWNRWRLFLSSIFPFSAFFVNYMNCVMWTNAILLMPLVFLGLDRILFEEGNSTWLYWLSLTILLFTNYYIGVIILIFLFLLTIFWIIDLLYQKRWLEIIKKGLKILILTIASILSAGVVMWPSYLAQRNVAQASMPKVNLFEPVYKFRLFWSALFSGEVKFELQSTAPLIFIGLLVIVLFLSYFFARKIKIHEKILTGLFTATLVASGYFLYFYMIWHSLSMPNGYYQRESFVISFFMICIAYRGLLIFENQHPLRILFSIVIGIGILMFGLQGIYKHLFDNNQLIHNAIILILLIIGAVFAVRIPKIGTWLMMVISLTNIVMYNLEFQAKAFKQIKNSDYIKVVAENQKVFNALRQYDHSFYRVGTTAQINECDPLLYGYNGIQTYLSQQPTSETDYLSSLGFYQKLGYTRWSGFNNGSTGMINDMLGIKYIVKSDSSILRATQRMWAMPTYNNKADVPNLSPVLKDKHTIVYKNPNAFPLAFGTYNEKGQYSVFGGTYDYIPEENPFISYNCLFKRLSGHWLYTMQPDFKLITYRHKKIAYGYLNSTGNVYCYITKSRWIIPNGNNYMPIEVNGKEVARYSNRNTFGENGIIYLGHFKRGDYLNIKIRNTQLDPELSQSKIYIAVEDQPMVHQIYKEATQGIGRIRADGPEISMRTTSKFKNRVLIVSVPYDCAWHVTVDGYSVKPQKVLGDLLGIKITPGKHNIQFNYIVRGIRVGMAVSVTAIIGLLIYEFMKKKSKRVSPRH